MPTVTNAMRTARQLERALSEGEPIEPLSESTGLVSIREAYQIQRCWTDLRRRHGETVLGHKIGLTSQAVQEQFGVHEPDYGSLWGSRFFPACGGLAEIPFDDFLQPRIEAELAFLIGEPLPKGPITAEGVIASTESIAIAIEVIDSRVKDWRVKLADTVADNASFGAFTLGPWSASLVRSNLATVELAVNLDGKLVTRGSGDVALGNPARCVVALAETLRSYGVELEPGDIVLSGSLVRAVPIAAGDTFTVTSEAQAPLSARFS